MATNNPNDPHAEIKDRLDLAEYIEKIHSTKGKKTGKNTLFNPAPCCGGNDCFMVDTAKQLFKCFQCEVKAGDIFTFIEEVGGDDREGGESLKTAAEFCGYELPKKEVKKQDTDKDPVNAVRNAAANYYIARLRDHQPSITYLTQPKPKGRNHTQRTIDKMEVGLSDGGLSQCLLEQGHSEEALKASGLYVERPDKTTGEVIYKDLFGPDLLIYPHRVKGKIGQFTCKDPSKKRKGYQLTREARSPDFFWGNQKAIEHNDEIHLVEGEDDLGSFFDASFKNTLMGNGQISEAQIGWLARHAQGKSFYFWFDNDPFKYHAHKGWQPSAGITYVRKIYQALLGIEGVHLNVCSHLMGEGVDPDDFVQLDQKSAHQRITKIMSQAINPLAWELEILPDELKTNPDMLLKYLKSDTINFFEYLPKLEEILKKSVMKRLEKLDFSQDAILKLCKETFSLAEEIKIQRDQTDSFQQKQEWFQRSIAQMVWGYFSDHGMFFVSGGENLNLFFDHKTYEVGKGDAWAALIHKEAGLNCTTPLSKFVNEELKAMCYQTGRTLDSLSWVTREMREEEGIKKNSLYYNFKDSQNRIVKITEGKIELIANGTNADKIMLTESDMLQELKYIESVDRVQAMGALKTKIFDLLTCAPAQRYLALAHGLSPLLMIFNQVRALMKLEGGAGSGKTTAARLMGLLLYGKDPIVNVTTASAYELGATEPLIVLDNIEKDDLKKDMLNFLLFAATGASRMKRKGGSDHGVTATKLNTLITITSIEPFVKPELINRTILIQFDKKHRAGGTVIMEEVIEEIIAGRNEMLSALLQIIAFDILPNFEAQRREVIQYITTSHPNHSKERMNEFITIYVLIIKALLPYIPLTGDLKAKCANKEPHFFLLDEWLHYQNVQAKDTERGTNQVLQFLEGLRTHIQNEMQMDEHRPVPISSKFTTEEQTMFIGLMGLNVNRITRDTEHEISFRCRTADLLRMFQSYAKERGIKVPFDTARQLASRMADQMPVLNDSGWTWGAGENGKKKIQGDNWYLCQWRYDETDKIAAN